MKSYSFSDSQCRVWLLQNESYSLLVQQVVKIIGKIDEEKLQECINSSLNSHTALCCDYTRVQDKLFPLQRDMEISNCHFNQIKVDYNDYIALGVQHISNLADKIWAEKFNDFAHSIFSCAHLFVVNENLSFFSLTIPSIWCDTVSMQLIVREIFTRLLMKTEFNNGDNEIQYPQFSGWQNSIIEEAEPDAVDFWKRNFQESRVMNSRFIFENKPFMSDKYVPETISKTIDIGKFASFENEYMPLNFDLNTLLVSSLTLLNYMHSLGGTNLGYVFPGRDFEELKTSIGLIAKTIPINVSVNEEGSFIGIIEEVNKSIKESSDWHGYYSSVKNSPRNQNGYLTGFHFGYEFVEESKPLLTEELSIYTEKIISLTDRFGLKLTAHRMIDKLIVDFTFDSSFISDTVITDYIEQYFFLLDKCLLNPFQKISEIDFEGFSNLKSPEVKPFSLHSDFTSIHQMFEKQVDILPNQSAVISGTTSISYKELNNKSDILANKLRDLGVGENVIVAIITDRSVEMIIGILGILKAGGAYLPIDPLYPASWVDSVFEDAEVKIVVKQNKGTGNYVFNKETVIIDELLFSETERFKSYSISDFNNLAYVIYTSGSTGMPKGVMVTHYNLMSLIDSLRKTIYSQYSTGKNVALVASYSFDGSVKQIFASLLLGHTLHIISDEIKTNRDQLIQYFRDSEICFTDLTPIHFDMLSKARIHGGRIGVDNILCGGQELRKSLIETFYEVFVDSPIIFNLYGPTECCVDASFFMIERSTVSKINLVPIGKTLPNSVIYILDKNKRRLPVGAVGEIYIGGLGVSKGYINNSELTKERFFELEDGSKHIIYRTGDYARFLSDGNIDYVGRKDSQVKVKGFRIELQEIEKVIASRIELQNIFVTTKKDDDDNKYLVAYIVAKNKLSLSIIFDALKIVLPNYMIPRKIYQIDKIPLTISGKPDNNKIINLSIEELGTETSYVAPRSEKEEKLVGLFQRILRKDKIGIDDNFFDKGGDSIKAIQLSAQIYKLGFKLNVRQVFSCPTVRAMGPLLENISAFKDVPLSGEWRLTPIQLAFFSSYDKNTHFNQALALTFNDDITISELAEIFNKIYEHHDMLRATFKTKNDKIIQEIMPVGGKLHIENIDFSGFDDESGHQFYIKKASEIQGAINIEKGPLIKLALFQFKNKCRLLIAIQHLVIDAYSWRIILDDIFTLYDSLRQSAKLTLPPKSDSFKTWADRMYDYAVSVDFDASKRYWNKVLQGVFFEIPKQRNEGTCYYLHSQTIAIELLDIPSTAIFLEKARTFFGVEPFEILLAAFSLAINKLFRLPRYKIYLENHGRNNFENEINISRTVGWFTVVYPFIVELDESVSLIDWLQKTKDNFRSIPENGLGYPLSQVEQFTFDTKKDFVMEIPNLLFNYFGNFDSDVKDKRLQVSTDVGEYVSPMRQQRYEVMVDCIVINGKLNATLLFNQMQYSESTFETIVKEFSIILNKYLSFYNF